MALEAPPKDKIKLFDHVNVHGNYVGVLRPVEREESDIEIPETAQKQESMENVTARAARIGPEIDHIEPGDKVLVSLYMQQPHQIVKQEDENDIEYHMFILDGDMIVGTVHDQREVVEDMLP